MVASKEDGCMENSFCSLSSDNPEKILVQTSDASASLGAQLLNQNKGGANEMFLPSYATIGKLLEGDTVAKRCHVAVGDCIVAVNGLGFRRFPIECEESDIVDLTPKIEKMKISTSNSSLSKTYEDQNLHRVLKGKNDECYAALLKCIKEAKSSQTKEKPFILRLERYGWDSRVHSWRRFLAARDGDVQLATSMIEEHEKWKKSFFPIDVSQLGIQAVLQARAISEIDLQRTKKQQQKDTQCIPTVYVDFGKLQTLESNKKCTAEDVVNAFVIFTETLLSRAPDPRNPKTCQFIDLTRSRLSTGLRVTLLKKIYSAFEPNYPETLHKMVMYPVSRVVRKTSNMLLSFVNEKTRNKFVITDDLTQVCQELGWDKQEVEECGGITEFMTKHTSKDGKKD